MIGPTTTRAKFIRRVSLVSGGAVVEAVDEALFGVQLTPPTESPSGDGSPREDAPYLLRWHSGLLGPADPQTLGGSRIQVASTVYELLGPSKTLRRGPLVVGYQARAHPVDYLYPISADLREQNGIVVESVPVAAWPDTKNITARGEYDQWLAEAPVDHLVSLGVVNRELFFDDKRYRIARVLPRLRSHPRVQLELRKL